VTFQDHSDLFVGFNRNRTFFNYYFVFLGRLKGFSYTLTSFEKVGHVRLAAVVDLIIGLRRGIHAYIYHICFVYSPFYFSCKFDVLMLLKRPLVVAF
jgi:hypothetical protein